MPTIYIPIELSPTQREIYSATVAINACHAHPTADRVAEFCDMPIKQVRADLQALAQIGLVSSKRRRRGE